VVRRAGPLTVPDPPGPARADAGGVVGAGPRVPAKWAELIFTGTRLDVARAHYKDQKEKIGERGRDPDSIKMCPWPTRSSGSPKGHAEEREQLFLHDLVDPMASLTLLSELMNYDFSGLSLDAPITDELIESVSGIRAWCRTSGRTSAVTRHLATWPGTGPPCCRGPALSGPPRHADQMEAWFDSGACDGFVIAATHSPGAYEDVVRLVVPSSSGGGLPRPLHKLDAARAFGLERPASVHGA